MPASGYVSCSLRAMEADALSRTAALRTGLVTMGRAVPAFLAWIVARLRECGDIGRRGPTRRRGDTLSLAFVGARHESSSTEGANDRQLAKDGDRMTASSSRSRRIRSSRKIASGRLRPSRQAAKQPAKPAREKSLDDLPAGTLQPGAASREDIGLRLEGRRLGRLGGGSLRVVCGCGHSGDVPVAALVARHGEEARVRDAVASMRCGACGAQRVAEVRWLE